MDPQGGLYTFRDGTYEEVKLLDVARTSPTGGSLIHVSAMVFNERLNTLWAIFETSIGNQTMAIGPDGQATPLANDTGDAKQDLSQSRSTQFIYGTDTDDDLDVLNNVTGQTSPYTDDMGFIAATGNALTFVGESLFLASGQALWMVDAFSGTPTPSTSLSIIEAPPGFGNFIVRSMTTRPSDNQVFAMVEQVSTSSTTTWLATLDPASGHIALLTPTRVALDGLAWVPASYFP